MRLVNDWKKSYKWLSMHCMTLAGAVQGAWLYIPQDIRQSVPQTFIVGITIGLLALGIFGRLIDQDKKK